MEGTLPTSKQSPEPGQEDSGAVETLLEQTRGPSQAEGHPVHSMIESVLEAFQREKAAQARALVLADEPAVHVDSLSEGIALGDDALRRERAVANLAALALGDDLAEAAARQVRRREGPVRLEAEAAEAALVSTGPLDQGHLAELMVSEAGDLGDDWNAAGLIDDTELATADRRR